MYKIERSLLCEPFYPTTAWSSRFPPRSGAHHPELGNEPRNITCLDEQLFTMGLLRLQLRVKLKVQLKVVDSLRLLVVL